ncbi:MAG: DUF4954 family protein [Muribaculaceae bacterium]|nr:DUF4954 family protein [Muribaculaceae bacterium]
MMMMTNIGKTPEIDSSLPRRLEWWQRAQLERQGCSSDNWDKVLFSPGVALPLIRNVHFGENVIVEEGAKVRNVPGGIVNCHIRKRATIENVARIEFEPEAACGVGTPVAALDETGSRPVYIYPGLSSQIATLMARVPKWVENKLKPGLQDFLDSKMVPAEIGEDAVVRDCGILSNVSVGKRITVEGASALRNGAIINNAPAGREAAYVGGGVDAENFIIEDGKVDSGCILRNCYVGQGVTLEKGFTAHDSLFFANCSFENGEACALLAGPYTVSMHKATLLIGCQTSFMNAGSATNQSNHMYKLGPVHWGLLERGVKTSSGAYMMFGAKIGAFTMVMGSHKTHPDSSSFPFSYLFGDERGATVVVPGAMLRSCGLLRDEKKWPTRDRRLKRKLPLNDRIIFNVLNPFTVDTMLNAIDTISGLLAHPADDDLYVRHKGMKFTRAALERAKTLYTAAIFKYLSMTLPNQKFPPSDGEEPGKWVDIGGQIMPRKMLEKALECEEIPEAEKVFSEAFLRYEELQLLWIGRRFGAWWRDRVERIPIGAAQFDAMVDDDREEYLENLSRETQMLAL